MSSADEMEQLYAYTADELRKRLRGKLERMRAIFGSELDLAVSSDDVLASFDHQRQIGATGLYCVMESDLDSYCQSMCELAADRAVCATMMQSHARAVKR